MTSPHVKGKQNFKLNEGKYTHSLLAVWFGNESKGISNEAIENSKFCVQMEMYGMVESMNLGSSTGIVLHEVTKQRRNYKK